MSRTLSEIDQKLLAAFDYQPRTRLLFGSGSVEQAGGLVNEFGGKKVLLVTDPGIVAAGHAGRIQDILGKSKLSVTLFDQVKENPTTDCVERCVAVARDAKIDFIVGLGGGSSMDTAKGCNFILTNGGRMQDYWGVGKATQPMLPLIAIPTTAGTGSECQSFALISDKDTHAKMACGDPKAAAKAAILDPKLTVSQPRLVTACTGIDAISHAVETAVTKKRNPLSVMFSQRAFQLMVTAFPKVLSDPDDLEARGDMSLGAAFAGIAIENSMLGATHSAANPLTAHFDIVHGQAVGMMLPEVVRFNGGDEAARAHYAALTKAADLAGPADPDDVAVEKLISTLRKLLSEAGMPKALRECDVRLDSVPALAKEAAVQWTANFNPRPVTEEDFVELYRAVF